MTKTMASLAAAAVLTALMLPGPASAADSKRADGLRNGTPQVTDISAQRRWRRGRVVRRYYRYPRRYRYYPRRYYYPYAYAPYPYPYYRRYYGPGFYFGGPGFGIGVW